MKTKLFSLFIAVFLFSISGKSQTNAKTAAPEYPVITLIGSGNGGWTDTAETPMLTDDGIHYSLVDKILTDGQVKFREGKCWETGCADTVTNTFGWGPVKAVSPAVQDTGWPSGTNAVPEAGTPNIECQAGSWTISFNRTDGTWSFVAGTPIPVIKLVGAAVPTPGGAVLTTADGILFSAKKVTLIDGKFQISIDGVLVGGAFPIQDTEAVVDTDITVGTTGIDYDVTFDFSTYTYTFEVATFPSVALVGAAVGGWPGQPGNPGPIDVWQMATNDGVTYTLNNVPMIPEDCVFRVGNDWNTKYGSVSFPSGSGNGADNITVPAGEVGTYNVSLNATTGAYTFTKITYSLVGDGAGGWPPFVGNDPNQLTTVDGVNYTLSGIVLTSDGVKFRLNNAWAGGDWGGTSFPSGTKSSGDNIPAVAGTYNLTVNVLTGAYDFGTALGVKNFSAGSFKAYPNPTQNSWTISGGTNKITSVHVYDMLGKSVYAKTTSSNDVSVNASSLSKGTYFAKVSTENGTSTVKLVKE